jgi:bifunctional non-homologous end joining protein LigD
VQYELRLEVHGRIKSWYFLQNLPATAGKRALAIEADEHPLALDEHFEGAIRTGDHHPVGTVMVWDRGRYSVRNSTANHGYRIGEMHLTLAGEKCAGRWTLCRLPTRSGARSAWLVIKEDDARSRPASRPADRARSVLTGRTIHEIAGTEALADNAV